MKKKLLSIVCAFFCIANVFVGCSIAPKTKGTPFSGEVVDLVEQQPRKEKKGYKFCGYFEDKNCQNHQKVPSAVKNGCP